MKFGYCILYVPSVLDTVKFYEAAFRLTMRFMHESLTYAEMETGETALAFAAESLVSQSHPFSPTRPAGNPPGAEVAFVVEDVPAAYAHALRAGAAPVAEPKEKPWGQTVSYVRDLNGFLVEICSSVAH